MKQASLGIAVMVAVTLVLGVLRARPWEKKEAGVDQREMLKVGFLPVT